jgi:hypothetical protein
MLGRGCVGRSTRTSMPKRFVAPARSGPVPSVREGGQDGDVDVGEGSVYDSGA